MTKFSKILLGCLAAGILLLGIGSAIAFFEISAIQYGGEKAYATNAQTTTKTFREPLDADISQINIYPGSIMSQDIQIIEDESVSTDQMIVEITYPGDCTYFYQKDYNNSDDYYYDDYDDGGTYTESYDGDYQDYYHQHNGNDEPLMMNIHIGAEEQNISAIFRQVVSDLKNGYAYSYYADSSVTIRVNPENRDKVLAY